jgi:hypothetical protein
MRYALLLTLFPLLLHAQTATPNSYVRAKTTGVGYEQVILSGANGITVTNASGTATIGGLDTINAQRKVTFGTVTIPKGDSIQVTVTGTASTTVVDVNYNGKPMICDTPASWIIPANGKITIYGKFNKTI